MPYLDDEKKNKFTEVLVNLESILEFENFEGELNYIISQLANLYLLNQGVCYKNLNTIIGSIECSKIEIYRRVAAPYEDIKIKENGDVFLTNVNEAIIS